MNFFHIQALGVNIGIAQILGHEHIIITSYHHNIGTIWLHIVIHVEWHLLSYILCVLICVLDTQHLCAKIMNL
jgi:hypothetical protein